MPNHRRGFTLVELLVAMALTVFILSIMAQAFVTGTDTFRTLKSVGDLNDSLRTAANMLKNDLAADHFEGKRRLSETRFWSEYKRINPATGQLVAYGAPLNGYFMAFRDPTPALNPAPDGTDPDGLPVFRSTSSALVMTVKARGNRIQSYYSALVPSGPLNAAPNDGRYEQPGCFNSQWIEVAWFPVLLSGTTAAGTPLYALYRQQRLVVGEVDQLNWATPVSLASLSAVQLGTYQAKVSCQPNLNPLSKTTLYFNSPADLTIPERRTAGKFPITSLSTLANTFKPIVDPTSTTGQFSGEDLVLQDVLSFDVKLLLPAGTAGLPVGTVNSNGTVVGAGPKTVSHIALTTDFYGVPYFDTWSQRHDDLFNYDAKANAPPLAASVLAVQITIRIWDPRTQITRQVTVVQDM